MKNINYILFAVIIFTAFIFTGCTSGSQKGKWSKEDLELFHKEVEKVDLSALGEYKAKWVECYLQKTQANYSSFQEANTDEKGCEKFALECSNEVLDGGSQIGKWSETDKKKFYTEIEGVDMSGLGEYKSQWIECYLKKIEAKYASFRQANMDAAGCEELAKSCTAEIIK